MGRWLEHEEVTADEIVRAARSPSYREWADADGRVWRIECRNGGEDWKVFENGHLKEGTKIPKHFSLADATESDLDELLHSSDTND